MNDRLEVFVLKQMDYREHDCIVQVLSKEYGVLSLFVRGMKKSTSKLAYAFQLFSFTTVELDLKDVGKMQTVKHASVCSSNRMLREDLDVLAIMSVIAELTLKVSEHHNLFDSLKKTMELLQGKSQKLTVLNLFLSHLVKLEGDQLMVDECVLCGKTQAIVTVSIEDGGFLCASCNQLRHFPNMDVDTLLAFRLIMKADLCHYDQIESYAVNQYAIARLLLDNLMMHSGIHCVSRRFLENFVTNE